MFIIGADQIDVACKYADTPNRIRLTVGLVGKELFKCHGDNSARIQRPRRGPTKTR